MDEINVCPSIQSKNHPTFWVKFQSVINFLDKYQLIIPTAMLSSR